MDPKISSRLDRKIILSLKVDFCRQRGIDASHFESELYDVSRSLEGVYLPDAVHGELLRLEEIHGELWHHQAWVEASGTVSDESVTVLAEMAVRMVSLRRERCLVKDEIDRLTGQYDGDRWVRAGR